MERRVWTPPPPSPRALHKEVVTPAMKAMTTVPPCDLSTLSVPKAPVGIRTVIAEEVRAAMTQFIKPLQPGGDVSREDMLIAMSPVPCVAGPAPGGGSTFSEHVRGAPSMFPSCWPCIW